MSFFQGGATPQAQAQINQNRNLIYSQGDNLNQQAQDRSSNYQTEANNYTNQADQANAPLIAGQGGYTAPQAAAIQNQSGLDSLQLTSDEQNAIKGNPTAGMTTGDQLSSNYLDAGEAQSIAGDQSGINAGLGQVNAAVDPNSVSTFTDNTRLTPQMQDQMAADASRSATNVDRATEDANSEAARASGADPLGVAGYTSQANRASQQDAALAASNARVTASNTAAAREQNILGANQTLDQQKAAAAATNLGAQQQMEANSSARAQSMALNRQTTGEQNQATAYGQAQTANTTATQQAAALASDRQAQGQYIDTATSGRATTVANQEQAQAAEGRQYLSNQIGGTTGAAQTEQGIQSGVYGTQTGAADNSTNTQVTASNRPSGFNQFLTAAGQAAGGAAAAYKASGSAN